MSNFRTGDVVRYSYGSEQGTIIESREPAGPSGEPWWLVEWNFSSGPLRYPYPERSLQLVTPKLEVGDRVGFADNREGTLFRQCTMYLSPECWLVTLDGHDAKEHVEKDIITRISLAKENSQEETKMAEQTVKFNVGDRVKIVGDPTSVSAPFRIKGKLGTIDVVDGSEYRVQPDGGESSWWLRDDHLEKVDEKRTPQIGDRVRVKAVKYPDEHGTNPVGRVGWFVCDDKDSQPYQVNFSHNRRSQGSDDYLYATEIELVEDENSQAPEGYVKAEDVYRLAERLCEEQGWCADGKVEVFRALADIGVSKPVVRKKLQVEFEVDEEKVAEFQKWAQTATTIVGGTPIHNVTMKEI